MEGLWAVKRRREFEDERKIASIGAYSRVVVVGTGWGGKGINTNGAPCCTRQCNRTVMLFMSDSHRLTQQQI